MIEVHSSPGGVEITLEPGLGAVLGQVTDLLGSVGRQGSDPAADRLSPRAYSDDDEAAAEFERLMAPELEAGRSHDREAYSQVMARLEEGPSVLDEHELFSTLRVIDEARLVVAARLGIDSDTWQPQGRMKDSPELHLYHLLGWIQDSVIEAMDPLLTP